MSENTTDTTEALEPITTSDAPDQESTPETAAVEPAVGAPAAPAGGDDIPAEKSAAAVVGGAETAAAITPETPDAQAHVPGGAQDAAAAMAEHGGDQSGGEAETADESHGSDADGSHADADDADDDTETDSAEGSEGGAASSGRPRRRAMLLREGEVAADFLETLLDICDLDGDLDVDIDGDRAAVALVDSDEGRVPRRLVGPDGEVLEALQELTRLAVQSETGERSRLMLDVAGHRAGRRAALVTLAKDAIDGVKSSGESTSLSPMTAFERKVVHDEVLAAGLVSESEGSEPRRYVVISPK